MNILITSAGRRVSLIKSFKKELKKRFPDGKVFITDMNPEFAPASYKADGYFGVHRATHPDYVKQLLVLCKTNAVKLLIPTIDTELPVLSKNRSLFAKQGVQIVISNESRIQCFANKRETHSFFAQRNISHPREYSKEHFKLPVFVKPFDGSRSINTHIVHKKEQIMPYFFRDTNLMFLEYLDHTLFDEYTCDLYYTRHGKLICAVPRKRMEVREGEVSKSKTEKNKLVAFLKEHMLQIDGLRGCITIQLFMNKKTGDVKGIEINPRFGGGFPLSYLSGANYPGWLIDEYLCNATLPERFDIWEDQLMMLRYDDEILVRNPKN
ncbi:ATP-grasp domain-containing protein [Ascidiimonas aurantiaca]|uniref:ATP-grasp domain-containing protein n=1 Tax=Ascidiimonas aurantiaca TaxID=1685432 RepID=UPI0030ECECF2